MAFWAQRTFSLPLARCAGVGKTVLLAVQAMLVGLAIPANAETFVVDPEHTEVRVIWDHLGLSRQSGRFMDVRGTVEFDQANPAASKVDVIIKVASIVTGSKKLDKHLAESKDFFDVTTHPEITFNSTGVHMTGEKTMEVNGDLMINGQVRPVVLNVTWNFTGEHPLAALNPTYTGKFSSGFSATTQFRRSDWGITRSAPLVSDELLVSIETEMHRKEVIGPGPDSAPRTDVERGPVAEPGPAAQDTPAAR